MKKRNKNIPLLNHHQLTFLPCYVFSDHIWLCC